MVVVPVCSGMDGDEMCLEKTVVLSLYQTCVLFAALMDGWFLHSCCQLCLLGVGRSTTEHGITAGTGMIAVITEYPQLEGIHKDHRVQLLALHKTAQKSHHVPENIV